MIQVDFRYPPPDSHASEYEWLTDFIRSSEAGTQRYDLCYVQNQQEAANYFLEWINGNSKENYNNLLRTQHRIASLGYLGDRPYRIPIDKNDWLVPEIRKDYIFYHTPKGSRHFRETYPGLFRSDLEEMNIEHPAIDILTVSKGDYDLCFSSCPSSPLMHMFRVAGRLATQANAQSAEQHQIIFPSIGQRVGDGILLTIMLHPDGVLERHAPTGVIRTHLFERCSQLATLIRNEFFQKTTRLPRFLLLLFFHYHSCINLMPFSNVNNSIFMGQVNACLRSIGMQGLPHTNWDTAAFITAPRDFAVMMTRLQLQRGY